MLGVWFTRSTQFHGSKWLRPPLSIELSFWLLLNLIWVKFNNQLSMLPPFLCQLQKKPTDWYWIGKSSLFHRAHRQIYNSRPFSKEGEKLVLVVFNCVSILTNFRVSKNFLKFIVTCLCSLSIFPITNQIFTFNTKMSCPEETLMYWNWRSVSL